MWSRKRVVQSTTKAGLGGGGFGNQAGFGVPPGRGGAPPLTDRKEVRLHRGHARNDFVKIGGCKMKRAITAVVGSLLFYVGMAVTPAFASAATFHQSVSKGAFADAGFDSTHGCFEKFAFVQGDVGRIKITGKPTVQSDAVVFISKVNNCTGTTLVEAFGVISPSSFHAARDASSATLTDTIPVFDDVSGTSFDVRVNMTWTNLDSTAKVSDVSHFKAPGFKELDKFSGTAALDPVASGTITAGATNYSPAGSLVFADLVTNLKSSTLDISH